MLPLQRQSLCPLPSAWEDLCDHLDRQTEDCRSNAVVSKTKPSKATQLPPSWLPCSFSLSPCSGALSHHVGSPALHVGETLLGRCRDSTKTETCLAVLLVLQLQTPSDCNSMRDPEARRTQPSLPQIPHLHKPREGRDHCKFQSVSVGATRSSVMEN